MSLIKIINLPRLSTNVPTRQVSKGPFVSTPKSPLYRNAFLFNGVHVMSGSQMHKLLTEGKVKDAQALDKEIRQKEQDLLRKLP